MNKQQNNATIREQFVAYHKPYFGGKETKVVLEVGDRVEVTRIDSKYGRNALRQFEVRIHNDNGTSRVVKVQNWRRGLSADHYIKLDTQDFYNKLVETSFE